LKYTDNIRNDIDIINEGMETPTNSFEKNYTDIELINEGDDGSKIYQAQKDGQKFYVKCKNVTK